MKSEYRLENARIVDIGLHYIGHYRQLSVRAELATRGGGCMVTIPQSKLPKLMDMFNDELEKLWHKLNQGKNPEPFPTYISLPVEIVEIVLKEFNLRIDVWEDKNIPSNKTEVSAE